MKFFTVNLKEKFPFLTSKQEPALTCYINDNCFDWNSSRKVPAILICPGGGYANVCFSREGEPIAFNYLRAGFSAFILTYSIQPEHYPQQLLEAAAAVLYIRQHAEEWHIEPDKIAINGYSAGGHLAASLGVFWNDPFILDILKTEGSAIRPDAMILGYPVISADASFSHIDSINNVSGTTKQTSPLYRKMSLETHVNKNTPEAFIWHTSDDNLVPVKNSLVLAEAFAQCGVPFELHIYPHGWHGLATADNVTNAPMKSPAYYCSSWIDESIKFLKALWYEFSPQ